jgi:hypothetical protein
MVASVSSSNWPNRRPQMQLDNHTQSTDREAVVVNRNLSIEITTDEILDDLLFPAHRAGGDE